MTASMRSMVAADDAIGWTERPDLERSGAMLRAERKDARVGCVARAPRSTESVLDLAVLAAILQARTEEGARQ